MRWIGSILRFEDRNVKKRLKYFFANQLTLLSDVVLQYRLANKEGLTGHWRYRMKHDLSYPLFPIYELKTSECPFLKVISTDRERNVKCLGKGA